MLAENNQELDLIELSEEELTLVNGGSGGDGTVFESKKTASGGE